MNKNYPTIALGTWSWGKGMDGATKCLETILSTFTKECRREDVLISTKFTPQIADEMAAEETGVDTRGSWEMPMI